MDPNRWECDGVSDKTLDILIALSFGCLLSLSVCLGLNAVELGLAIMGVTL